jgi:hypothetical protein
VGGVHHTLEGIHFAIDRGDIAPVGSEIKSGAIYLSAGDEDFRFSRWMYLARQNTVGPDSPVFGPAIFLQKLDALSSPGVVRGDTKSLSYDAVDLGPEQKLIHRELLAGAKRSRGLIADLEDGGPRYRLLVILDFVFYVQLVLVLERPRTVLRHGFRQG